MVPLSVITGLDYLLEKWNDLDKRLPWKRKEYDRIEKAYVLHYLFNKKINTYPLVQNHKILNQLINGSNKWLGYQFEKAKPKLLTFDSYVKQRELLFKKELELDKPLPNALIEEIVSYIYFKPLHLSRSHGELSTRFGK